MSFSHSDVNSTFFPSLSLAALSSPSPSRLGGTFLSFTPSAISSPPSPTNTVLTGQAYASHSARQSASSSLQVEPSSGHAVSSHSSQLLSIFVVPQGDISTIARGTVISANSLAHPPIQASESTPSTTVPQPSVAPIASSSSIARIPISADVSHSEGTSLLVMALGPSASTASSTKLSPASSSLSSSRHASLSAAQFSSSSTPVSLSQESSARPLQTPLVIFPSSSSSASPPVPSSNSINTSSSQVSSGAATLNHANVQQSATAVAIPQAQTTLSSPVCVTTTNAKGQITLSEPLLFTSVSFSTFLVVVSALPLSSWLIQRVSTPRGERNSSLTPEQSLVSSSL
ncbi:hypothetical protein B0H21DRAFT_532611 [Amylocystis lapponica]|nr:hypothetical protein B0H21DRAFT_532611 [Amylocystis lapponica]